MKFHCFLDILGDFYVNISLTGRNRNHIQKENRSKLPGLHRILIDTTPILEKLSSFINLILKNQFNLVGVILSILLLVLTITNL